MNATNPHRYQRPADRPRCCCHVGRWFNPRRRMNAQALIDYLRWHGRKIFLTDDAYDAIAHECGLDRHQTDLAVDDLFTLGMVTMGVGAHVAVSLLSDDLNKWGGQ